jgi:hypothetical protein
MTSSLGCDGWNAVLAKLFLVGKRGKNGAQIIFFVVPYPLAEGVTFTLHFTFQITFTLTLHQSALSLPSPFTFTFNFYLGNYLLPG